MVDAEDFGLSDIECHFKWEPDANTRPLNYEIVIKKLKADVVENPDVEVMGRTLLSYILFQNEQFEEAQTEANGVIEKCKCNGEKLVSFANKASIYDKRKQHQEVRKLIPTVRECKGALTSDDEHQIKLIHAFSLTMFGIVNFTNAKVIYEEILDRHEICYAYFGLAKVLGRLRRYHHSNRSKPSQKELHALSKACELSAKNNKSFYLAQYGFAKAENICHGRENIISMCKDTEKILDQAVEELIDSRQESCHVHKWCAMAYKKLYFSDPPDRELKKKYTMKQKEHIDEAIRINPHDTMALHDAALLYWKARPCKNLDKARLHFEKACRNTPSGNYWADVDYVKFRKQQGDENLKVMDEYVKLIKKYEKIKVEDEPLNLAHLHMLCGEELEKLNDKKSAVKEFISALKLDPTMVRVKEAKRSVLSILKDDLRRGRLNALPESDEVPLLEKIGIVYWTIADLSEAELYFKSILEKDPGHEKAPVILCKIYHKRKEYLKCIETGELLPDFILNKRKMRIIISESNYHEAVNPHNDPNTAKEHLSVSAKYGLLDAGWELLYVITEENKFTKFAFEISAHVCLWFTKSEGWYFKLEQDKKPCDLADEAHLLVIQCHPEGMLCTDLVDQVSALREERFQMTKSKVGGGKHKAMQVLHEAKKILDRSLVMLKECCTRWERVSKACNYPYAKSKERASKSKENLEEAEEIIRERMEKKKGNGLKGFEKEFPEVFKFLCETQPSYDPSYEFIPEFIGLVNKDKHVERICNDEQLYLLSHQVCEHLEHFVLIVSRELEARR